MLFNSHGFILGFLPVVLCTYYAVAQNRAAREGLLVCASIFFYGMWDPRFVPLLLLLTTANWGIAVWFGRERARWIPSLGIVMNLAVLAVVKYSDFIRGSIFELAHQRWTPWHLILPLGISFFVFQKISYLADLRSGKAEVYGLLDFTLFVQFFPQLIAGPIVRHNEIVPQFRADPRSAEMWENIGRGLTLFTLGVFKKVAIADTLAPFIDSGYSASASTPPSIFGAWTVVLAYGLQLYFDFSGYSDMAIGLGRMFGFRLPHNFDAPYRGASIQEFWRCWHMTLSRFLRDYVYIPLYARLTIAGPRTSVSRQGTAMVITMLLAGLWHGAGWTFVAWGGMHGLALAINQAWNRWGFRLPRLLTIALTQLFVFTSLILFRAPTFREAATMASGLAGLHGTDGISIPNEVALALMLGAGIAAIGPTSQQVALVLTRPSQWIAVAVGLTLSWLLVLIGGRLPNVFIYFQF
jgi:alginate O-acetyltransferase complex protein AlgI